jgi:hypothetical protein
MPHRYLVGDLVVARSHLVPAGPYTITRLLPSAAGEPHYHGRSRADGHHRALTEGQLRPAPAQEVKPPDEDNIVAPKATGRKKAGRK